jgi:hypothetical protein
VFERVGAHFSEAELVALDMKIRRRTPCSRIAAMMSGTAPAISSRDLNDWPTPRVEMTAS